MKYKAEMCLGAASVQSSCTLQSSMIFPIEPSFSIPPHLSKCNINIMDVIPAHLHYNTGSKLHSIPFGSGMARDSEINRPKLLQQSEFYVPQSISQGDSRLPCLERLAVMFNVSDEAIQHLHRFHPDTMGE